MRRFTLLVLSLGLLVFSAQPGAAQTYAFTTIAGTPYRTQNWFGEKRSYTDGPAATARFVLPSSLAVDAAGNVYVLDALLDSQQLPGQLRALRKITPAGVVSTLTVAKSNPTEPELSDIASVAIAPDGTIYVSQFTSTIRRITPTGVLSTLATAVRALGIAVDREGNVVTAVGSYVQKITPAGVVSIIAGQPDKEGSMDGPVATALFRNAHLVACVANGDVYVGEMFSRVRRISAAGVVTTAVDGLGPVESSGDTYGLAQITGLAVTPSHTLLLSAGSTVRGVSPDGALTHLAGQVYHQDHIDGVGGAARFMTPSALTSDASGNVYLVDGYGGTIRKGVPSSAITPPIIQVMPTGMHNTIRHLGVGRGLALSVAASGTEPLSYQWFKDGNAIPGATTPQFSRTAAAADEGTYTVLVTNAAGGASPLPVSIRVFGSPFSAFTPRRSVAGGSFLWGIVSGPGLLVAVGTAGTILASVDGQTWTRRESGTSEWLVGVAYGGGKYVAVGDKGLVLVSTDGIRWTPRRSGTDQRLNNVVFGGGRFVAVGERGTIVTSADGETWVARTTAVSGWLRGLIFVQGVRVSGFYAIYQPVVSRNVFYTAGQNGVVLSSLDGESWSAVVATGYYGTQPPRKDIEALISGSGVFAGIGQDGSWVGMRDYFIASKGGGAQYFQDWFVYDIGLPIRFRGLVTGAGASFAMGENGLVAGTNQGASGPWAIIPTGTTSNLVNGTFHGNSLYVVGENETILQSEALYTSRLINIATRGAVGAGANAMISGFVVVGDVPKPILLRAAGPALNGFGVSGALAAPVLTLFDGAGSRLDGNTRWSTAPNAAAIADAAARVGAFSFVTGSADSALLVTLAPGAYTAQVTGVGTGTGVALVEAYDAERLSNEGSRAINISTRGHVGAGAERLIAGFVIGGASTRRVLIRAAGPSLEAFGVTGALAEPQIELYSGTNHVLQRAQAWSLRPDADEIRGAAQLAGAFALLEDSRDAAMIVTLFPGSYTVQVSGLNTTTGVALVEVYDLP